jgi:hypothetical protein
MLDLVRARGTLFAARDRPPCRYISFISITIQTTSIYTVKNCRTSRKEATVTAGKIIQNIDGKLRPDHDWRMQVTDEFANTIYELQVSARKPRTG